MGISYEIVVEDIEPPYVLKNGGRFLDLLSATAERITGVKPQAGVKTGFTEMALFGARGIKAITFGPGNENLAHVVNEHIEIKEVIDSVRIFVTFLLSL